MTSPGRDGDDAVPFTFNAAQFTARPGQSVGAALIGNGITAWRATRRDQRPRGLFCGIGVCFDCLVTVDGAPSQRACLVEVQPGMRVEGDRFEGDTV